MFALGFSAATAAADLFSSLQAGVRYTVFRSSGVTCHLGCFRPLKTALYCRHANEAVTTNQESTGANQEQLDAISSPAGRRVPAVAMSHHQPALLVHTAWMCSHGSLMPFLFFLLGLISLLCVSSQSDIFFLKIHKKKCFGGG